MIARGLTPPTCRQAEIPLCHPSHWSFATAFGLASNQTNTFLPTEWPVPELRDFHPLALAAPDPHPGHSVLPASTVHASVLPPREPFATNPSELESLPGPGVRPATAGP